MRMIAAAILVASAQAMAHDNGGFYFVAYPIECPQTAEYAAITEPEEQNPGAVFSQGDNDAPVGSQRISPPYSHGGFSQ